MAAPSEERPLHKRCDFLSGSPPSISDIAHKYTLRKIHENTHIWDTYFPRDPEERHLNESCQTKLSKLFNIEVISPRDLEVSFRVPHGPFRKGITFEAFFCRWLPPSTCTVWLWQEESGRA